MYLRGRDSVRDEWTRKGINPVGENLPVCYTRGRKGIVKGTTAGSIIPTNLCQSGRGAAESLARAARTVQAESLRSGKGVVSESRCSASVHRAPTPGTPRSGQRSVIQSTGGGSRNRRGPCRTRNPRVHVTTLPLRTRGEEGLRGHRASCVASSSGQTASRPGASHSKGPPLPQHRGLSLGAPPPLVGKDSPAQLEEPAFRRPSRACSAPARGPLRIG